MMRKCLVIQLSNPSVKILVRMIKMMRKTISKMRKTVKMRKMTKMSLY